MKVLYIDNDDKQRHIYTVYLENIIDGLEVVEMFSTENAAIHLHEFSEEIDMILMADSSEQDVGGFYEFCRKNLSRIPFVFMSSQAPENYRELQGFKTHHLKNEFIQFPVSPSDFREVILSVLSPSFGQRTIHAFKKIRLFQFYRFNQVLCPVYLKLSDRKYVKVFSKQEVYTKDDLDKIKEKGIDYLYIRNDDFNMYQVTLTKTPFLAMDAKGLPPDEIEERVKNTHIMMHELLQNLGFSKEVESMAEKSIESIVDLSRENKDLFNMLQSMRSQLDYIYDHSYLTSLVCCQILKGMNWGTQEMIRSVCMASLFHDMALSNPSLAMIERDDDPELEKFSEEEKKLFLNHPFKIANVVGSSGFAPPEVETIIRQHHENVEGNGFPNKLSPNKLSKLTCVFIVAHEYVLRLYQRDFEQKANEKILAEIFKKYDSAPFKSILKVLDDLQSVNQNPLP